MRLLLLSLAVVAMAASATAETFTVPTESFSVGQNPPMPWFTTLKQVGAQALTIPPGQYADKPVGSSPPIATAAPPDMTKVARFGIRNTGSAYTLAGGHPNLVAIEVQDNGTVVADLASAMLPDSAMARVEGKPQTLATKQVSAHRVVFAMPEIEQNGVAVIVVDAALAEGS